MRMSDLRSDVCSSDLKLGPLLELSAAYQALAHHTVDHIEAVDAFIAKRRPVWADECRKLSLGPGIDLNYDTRYINLVKAKAVAVAVMCFGRIGHREARCVGKKCGSTCKFRWAM